MNARGGVRWSCGAADPGLGQHLGCDADFTECGPGDTFALGVALGVFDERRFERRDVGGGADCGEFDFEIPAPLGEFEGLLCALMRIDGVVKGPLA